MEHLFSLNTFRAIVILIITGAAAAAVTLFFRFLRKKRAKLHIRFLGGVITFLILVVGIYSALSQFSIAKEISSTLITGGALIIAVATFAAQKALGNVISGFALSASRPFAIGDKVRILQGSNTIAEGLVKDMTIRHIVIEQFDGQSCIVPNSLVDESVIVNTNYVSNVGNFIEFEVAYGTDVELAKSIILDVCHAEPLLVEKERIRILTSRLSQNGLILKFAVWAETVDDSFILCSNIRQKTVAAFRAHGIEIPYQTVTLDK